LFFFGERADPDLPAVAIYSRDPIERSMEILKWMDYHYSTSGSWFMKVYDDTFVHPLYLLEVALCNKDPSYAWYIGEKGSSNYVPMDFAGATTGYIFSRQSLKSIVHAWSDGHCTRSFAEDITVAICMNQLGVPLTAHAQFKPKIEHGYFQPWPEFVTLAHIRGPMTEVVAKRAFDHCGYT